MPFVVESKRRKLEALAVNYPDAAIIDVTSKANLPWRRFSPFYPHGNIPIPFSDGLVGASVEGIWQGLKVFEREDVDSDTIANTTMKGIKRSTRTRGSVLGHRAGLNGKDLLSYKEARYLIYLPCYKWVLEHYLHAEINQLTILEESQLVVLLDYETNGNIDDLHRPLSHAALITKFITGDWLSDVSKSDAPHG